MPANIVPNARTTLVKFPCNRPASLGREIHTVLVIQIKPQLIILFLLQTHLHFQSFVDELDKIYKAVLDIERLTELLSIAQEQRCRESKGFISKISFFKCLQVDIGTCMFILDTEEKIRSQRKIRIQRKAQS